MLKIKVITDSSAGFSKEEAEKYNVIVLPLTLSYDGKDYLDVTLIQRSSDFCTASVINQAQYVAFLKMIAAATGLIAARDILKK